MGVLSKLISEEQIEPECKTRVNDFRKELLKEIEVNSDAITDLSKDVSTHDWKISELMDTTEDLEVDVTEILSDLRRMRLYNVFISFICVILMAIIIGCIIL